MKISVNVPSFQRPGRVGTLKYIPTARLWVCETEAQAYRDAAPWADIVPVPYGVQGNVSRIRNWILDHEYERGVEAVCMVDDDLKNVQYFEKKKRFKVLPEGFLPWLEFYTGLADEWGVKLWGVNINNDAQSYREYTPFGTLSFVGGPFSVHIRSDLRYDVALPLKEDYDMTLQHLNKYRGVLRLNKFYLYVDQAASGGGSPGGCSVYRNSEYEAEQVAALILKWGPDIVRLDAGKSRCHASKLARKHDFNPIIRVPIRGV